MYNEQEQEHQSAVYIQIKSTDKEIKKKMKHKFISKQLKKHTLPHEQIQKLKAVKTL